MTHDAQCEQRGHTLQVYQPDWCRCEVRALEAKLADAVAALAVAGAHCDRMAPLPDGRRSDDGKRFIEQHVGTTISVLAGRADDAESRLARLRPVVRAAVVLDDKSEWHVHVVAGLAGALNREVLALTPAVIEWAKGGE